MRISRRGGVIAACVLVAGLAASQVFKATHEAPRADAGDAGAPDAGNPEPPEARRADALPTPVRRPAPPADTPETDPLPAFAQAVDLQVAHESCRSFSTKPGIYVTPARLATAYAKDLGLGAMDELREASKQVRDGYEHRVLHLYHDGVLVSGNGELLLRMLGVPGKFVERGFGCFKAISGPARPKVAEREAIRRARDAVAKALDGPIARTTSVLQYNGLMETAHLRYEVTIELDNDAPAKPWRVEVDAMTAQILTIRDPRQPIDKVEQRR